MILIKKISVYHIFSDKVHIFVYFRLDKVFTEAGFLLFLHNPVSRFHAHALETSHVTRAALANRAACTA